MASETDTEPISVIYDQRSLLLHVLLKHLPTCTTLPASITTIVSALRMVLMRCAITTTARVGSRFSMATYST